MKSQEMNICLWYKDQAEEAANYYTSIFQDSEIGQITRFGKEGFEYHGQPEGSAMAVDFRLNQMKFIAVNGATKDIFNDSVSIVIQCETQEEIDHYWSRLTDGGQEMPCGWLKDRFGVSWQITPAILPKYLTDEDTVKRNRVEHVAFQMKKFDIEALQKAYNGI
jgi:predicted 3-demethylubiquinone-9 3-methyltransferase (glyoxalase superfamily)